MAKRYNNLYEKIVTLDNIKNAHKNARKDKKYYTAVQYTDAHLEERAQEIQNMLKDHSYKVSNYTISILHDKRKDRILYKLPYYPDRIIQWAIMLQTEKIFQEVFTDFTCASLPKKGIHYASNMLQNFLNNHKNDTTYCLKMDIKKFYPSIDREILKKLLRKKFKDKDLLIEFDKIIDSMETTSLKHLPLDDKIKELYSRPGKGLPVGSYLSQYLANYYLSYFDHWLKEELHCKYVIRYMDDIVVLSNSKEFLHNVFIKSKKYLEENLLLTIKSNYQIFPVNSRGVDFVGYRHFHGYKLLRKDIAQSYKKTMKGCLTTIRKCGRPSQKQWHGFNSYNGWIKRVNSKRFYNKYSKQLEKGMQCYYKTCITTRRNNIYSIPKPIYRNHSIISRHLIHSR